MLLRSAFICFLLLFCVSNISYACTKWKQKTFPRLPIVLRFTRTHRIRRFPRLLMVHRVPSIDFLGNSLRSSPIIPWGILKELLKEYPMEFLRDFLGNSPGNPWSLVNSLWNSLEIS